MSYVRTALLLAALTGIFLVVGDLVAGRQGMVIAFFFACAMNLFAYWNSDKMVLSMYGAREVDEQSAPQLFALVRDLTRRGGLPMPRVFMIESDQPNAFATGRDPQHAAVAVNTGLLRLLSPEEVAGVLGHELSHVRNRDSLTMTMTAVIAGAIGMLANFAFFFGGVRNDRRDNPLGPIAGLVVLLVAPLAATMVQLAISRTREFAADRSGAELCGHPLWLASALGKLEQGARQIPNLQAEGHPATAHIFIVNPLRPGVGMAGLFSTHPPIEERIRRLEAMAGEMGEAPAPQRGPWG